MNILFSSLTFTRPLSLLLALMLGTTSPVAVFAIERPAFPISNGFSRGIQAATGINFMARKVAEAAIARELKPQFQRKPKVKLKLYSAGDLAAGKLQGITVSGRHLVLGVPFTTLTLASDSAIWLHLASKPKLKVPVKAHFSGMVTEADLNRMLANQPTRLKLKLPALGEQTLLALNPQVRFKQDVIQLKTTLNVPGASLDTALPIVFEGQLQPSPDKRRLVWRNLNLSSSALTSPELVSQFVEQQFGKVLSFGSQQVSGHPLQVMRIDSTLQQGEWLLTADMSILPPKP
jgi:hypothetical protein